MTHRFPTSKGWFRNGGWFWMIVAVGLAVLPGAAMAQGQGQRLGLVIGLADYGEVKHPTALQDAGLVAQSLRQVGFVLTEAANLNQTEFRTTFRDFIEKAQAAGPDTLIAVYISGIGFQEDGENLLIPVEARLRQRVDLALEGLRVSDFLRTLGAIPAAGRLVVLDAAYTHPYARLAGEGSRGFAAGERREGILLAYNQAPDRVSPLPTTSYGHFAMALAEVLVSPGLDLAAMFERIRLRTHDLSQGAETPWDINGLSQPVVLLPGAAAPTEAALVSKRNRALRELPGDEAYARAVEIDTITTYEEFLSAHPTHAQARRVRGMIATRREAYYWQRARRANTDRAYWSYLRRYPRGAHASEAQARLSRLSSPIVPPPQFDEIFYDDLPPPDAEEIEVYETVVIEERWDILPPTSGYAVHLLPPPPLAIIELPPPPPNPLARTLPSIGVGAAIVGAGAVGAAIWANREWRRPRNVRPVMVPPPRPPRASVLPPGTVIPPPPRPGSRPVGVPPPVGVPVGNPARPVTQIPPPPPAVTPPVGTPPVVVPPRTRPPGTPPGAIRPTVPPPGPRPIGSPPPDIPSRPTATPPGAVPRPTVPPPAVIPPAAPQAPRPIGAPPPPVQARPPQFRPVPPRPGPGELPPQFRPVPRPPSAAPPQIPAQRPIGAPPPKAQPARPPAARPVAPPPPVARPIAPQPPVARPVPPPPPAARPPAARPAPPPPPPATRPPAARPPAPGPIGQCTPELRARGACR